MTKFVKNKEPRQKFLYINSSILLVDSSIQCNMLDKENVPPVILCKGNDDEKFYPLVQKHRGTFKDLSGMYHFILPKYSLMMVYLCR